jgi:DNA primase
MTGLDLITSGDKVYFAERGETKADLADHYLRVAEPLLRAMGGRPVLLQRFPEGASGPSFFQKRVPKNKPSWLQTTTVATPNGTTSEALVAADIDHVLWAVNLGCLGVPGSGSLTHRRAEDRPGPYAGCRFQSHPARGT